MPQVAPNTEGLDEHLSEIVQALHRAVRTGIPHVNEPKIVDKTIADCREILDVIMEGNISEWLN
jgi:hypothetical protein